MITTQSKMSNDGTTTKLNPKLKNHTMNRLCFKARLHRETEFNNNSIFFLVMIFIQKFIAHSTSQISFSKNSLAVCFQQTTGKEDYAQKCALYITKIRGI